LRLALAIWQPLEHRHDLRRDLRRQCIHRRLGRASAQVMRETLAQLRREFIGAAAVIGAVTVGALVLHLRHRLAVMALPLGGQTPVEERPR
jgi:hypothetical protein